jgi:diacylglycerol kinase (ATP)
MHALLIHNPTAGTASHTVEALTAFLKEAGYTVTASSTKQGHYKKCVKERADLILVAGGDGAIARVIRSLPNFDAPLAILPLGTANNIARSLGVEGEPEVLLDCIRQRTTTTLDLGLVNGGPWKKRRFVEGIGVGLLANWMYGASSKPPAHERTKIGRELLREALTKAVPRHCSLNIDDHELSQELLLVEILNTRFIGPALPLGASSEPGDKLFDLVYLLPEMKSEMLSWLDNPQRTASPLRVRQGRKIIFHWENGPLHIDDRSWEGPDRDVQLTVKLAPRALEVCAPRSRGRVSVSSPPSA